MKLGMGVSVIGLAGGLWGFLAFLLPRLWIGIAYLKGEGEETDESLRAFLKPAVVAFAYVPAIAAALVVPPSVRWAVLLLVAGITQVLPLRLTAEPGFEVAPLLALPATLLLLIGATTSFRRWRESRGGGGLVLKGGKR